MPHVNNLFNVIVQNVSENGSVDFGCAIIKGMAANSKEVGGQEMIGNMVFSPVFANGILNVMKDPDVIDQAQSQL